MNRITASKTASLALQAVANHVHFVWLHCTLFSYASLFYINEHQNILTMLLFTFYSVSLQDISFHLCYAGWCLQFRYGQACTLVLSIRLTSFYSRYQLLVFQKNNYSSDWMSLFVVLYISTLIG